jgi:hypothetical protein
MAVYEKVTREYLMQSPMNTIDNDALDAEHSSSQHTYSLQEAEQAKSMVIPTP